MPGKHLPPARNPFRLTDSGPHIEPSAAGLVATGPRNSARPDSGF